MPELPEVETVKRGLEALLEGKTPQILKIETSDKKLRYNPDLDKLDQVTGEPIRSVQRKAKYLLFELETHYLLSHLGMTGSWRIEKDQRKHDHIRIHLSDGRVLTYHDARRFGFFEIHEKNKIDNSSHFAKLGLDPVLDKGFNGEYLYEKCRGKNTAIKTLIMNNQFVVGVGNIYASESLFLAGIHPKKKASKISRKMADRLAESIREVLYDAIDCGGSTISDFVQAGGSEGYFQNLLLVYGRDKEECMFCKTMIRSQAIVGRNSFWCSTCQKM